LTNCTWSWIGFISLGYTSRLHGYCNNQASLHLLPCKIMCLTTTTALREYCSSWASDTAASPLNGESIEILAKPTGRLFAQSGLGWWKDQRRQKHREASSKYQQRSLCAWNKIDELTYHRRIQVSAPCIDKRLEDVLMAALCCLEDSVIQVLNWDVVAGFQEPGNVSSGSLRCRLHHCRLMPHKRPIRPLRSSKFQPTFGQMRPCRMNAFHMIPPEWCHFPLSLSPEPSTRPSLTPSHTPHSSSSSSSSIPFRSCMYPTLSLQHTGCPTSFFSSSLPQKPITTPISPQTLSTKSNTVPRGLHQTISPSSLHHFISQHSNKLKPESIPPSKSVLQTTKICNRRRCNADSYVRVCAHTGMEERSFPSQPKRLPPGKQAEHGGIPPR